MENDTRQLGQFIPLHYHHNMLHDEARVKGFKTAIEMVVKPGDVVLELGGGTGVQSFFAAQTAKKIYCVEYNPELVEESRRLLKLNKNGDKAEVIRADAAEYVPPEPVDVVICEMLHVGLLQEKQLPVLNSFKSNYKQKFGDTLPFFIPYATLQAVQLVRHDFSFEDYFAPVVHFQDAYGRHPRTTEISDPVIYHQLIYDQPFDLKCKFDDVLTANNEGTVNALRFITKSILTADPTTQEMADWHNNYMVLPLGKEIDVTPPEQICR